jgi:hypothetical protein
MVYIAIILFLFAAVFGLTILAAVLQNKKTPKPAVVFHGSLVFIAFFILISYTAATYAHTGHVPTLLLTSLILFLIAALGGLTLLTIDMSNKRIPKLLAVIHPLLAVTAVVILIFYALHG